MGAKAPEQVEALAIMRNEWSSLQECLAAAVEFPRCGQCKGIVKVSQVGGRWFALCSRRPSVHHSMRRLA